MKLAPLEIIYLLVGVVLLAFSVLSWIGNSLLDNFFKGIDPVFCWR